MARGSNRGRGKVFFFSPFQIVQTRPKPQPASYSVGTGVNSWPGRDADHSPPSGAEVKHGFSHISTPTISIRA